MTLGFVIRRLPCSGVLLTAPMNRRHKAECRQTSKLRQSLHYDAWQLPHFILLPTQEKETLFRTPFCRGGNQDEW